jgi:hypothetical protein
MVPMWDALNHITGKANVCLHHSLRRGALQMIATRDIKEGQQVPWLLARPHIGKPGLKQARLCSMAADSGSFR